MSPKALLWFAFLFLGLIGPSMAQSVNEPPYSLVKNEPPFEVRDYGVLTVADTVIDGDFDVAGSLGFRPVTGYIFGKNQSFFINQLKNKMEFQSFLNLKTLMAKIFLDIKNENNFIKKTIVFSPASASFDSFRNFEERGKHFNKLIKKHIKW